MSELGSGEVSQGPKPDAKESAFVGKSDALTGNPDRKVNKNTKLPAEGYTHTKLTAEGYTHTKQPVREVLKAERAELLRDVAPSFGVTIKTVASEGESYEALSGYSGTVPEGDVFVEIREGNNKSLQDFWNEVNAEQARRDAAAKPQKP